MVFRQPVSGCNFADRFRVEVATKEKISFPLRQSTDKTLNRVAQFLCNQFILHAACRVRALRQFLQYRLNPAAAPLFGGHGVPTIQGKIPRDPGQKVFQPHWPLGRDGVPGVEPGVIDAFLRIFAVMQNVFGNRETVSAILLFGLSNGFSILFPVQLDDLAVFHSRTSFLQVKGLSLSY